MNSKIYSLPTDMKEKVLKLAREHGITTDEAYKYYLMGGENADYLCCLKDAGCSEGFIELHNQVYWGKKSKKIWQELTSINDKAKSDELHNTCKKFILTLAEELKIYKFLDWLNEKLSKIGF